MCAVQVQGNRLAGATRGLAMLRLLLLLLLGIWQAAGLPTPWPDTTDDECRVEYLMAFENASSTYVAAYERCELTANETQIDLSIDEERERAQIEGGRSTLCSSIALCNSLEDNLEYLECVKDNGSQNIDLVTRISYNASSAYTRLRQDFDEVQQTLALCTLDAQVEYINSVRAAHEQLLQCRSETAD